MFLVDAARLLLIDTDLRVYNSSALLDKGTPVVKALDCLSLKQQVNYCHFD
jgi:hypothetical protein